MEHFGWLGTGLEHSAMRLCQGLARRGHEVHVLAASGESIKNVKVHRGLDQVESLRRSLQPDLVIDWGFIHPADIHRMGAGTHAGYLDYYLDAFHGFERWWRRLERWAPRHQRVIRRQRWLLARSGARFVANSNLTAKMAIAGGAPLANVSVCHQHVPLEIFDPERSCTRRFALRKQWGLGEDEVAFLFVAHNFRLKNLDLLRQVMSSLGDSPARLVVVGKRQPRWTAPWLVFAGEVRDMAAVYGAGDVLVHPTYFDSCANVVLEAMACAKPILVSDTAGIDELLPKEWVLGVRGVSAVVEESWLRAVRALASDSVLRRQRGTQARALAEKRDYASFLEWFENYMRSVLKDKEAGIS